MKDKLNEPEQSQLKSALMHINHKLDLLDAIFMRTEEAFYPVCKRPVEETKDSGAIDLGHTNAIVIDELYTIEIRIKYITDRLSDLCDRSIV